MTDPVPSKEQIQPCPHGRTPDLCRQCMRAEIDRLQTTLRGIQSCSTCEACRGAATLALGSAQTPAPPISEPMPAAQGLPVKIPVTETLAIGGAGSEQPSCPIHGAFVGQADCVHCRDLKPVQTWPAREPDKFDLAFEIMRQLEAEDMETMQSCQFGYVMRVTRERAAQPPGDGER